MNLKYVIAIAAFSLSLALPGVVAAETLATPPPRHHRSESGGMPTRGMSMAQVERRYGAPESKLPTAGGDKPRHPPIHRWHYAGYTVYFERSRVIHSVADGSVNPPS